MKEYLNSVTSYKFIYVKLFYNKARILQKTLQFAVVQEHYRCSFNGKYFINLLGSSLISLMI